MLFQGLFLSYLTWLSVSCFFQKLQSQHAESTGALKKSQSEQHTQLSSAISAEQSSLAQSRKEIADWSQSVSADLQKRDADVEKFLTEDLTKDVPTGLQNVLILVKFWYNSLFTLRESDENGYLTIRIVGS